MHRAALALLLSGCIGGGTGLDLPGLDVVYECDVGAEPAVPFRVELCWPDGAQSLEDSLALHFDEPAACGPTSRHAGPCIYRCDGGRGSNATGGSWCPP